MPLQSADDVVLSLSMTTLVSLKAPLASSREVYADDASGVGRRDVRQ